MFRSSVALLLLAHAFIASIAQVQTTTSSATIASTCPSQSINYITHSLPQQCLTTSWTSKASLGAATDEGVQTSSGPVTSLSGTQDTTITTSTSQLGSVEGSANVPSTFPSQSNATPSAIEASKKPEATLDAYQEGDSPLDNANFLSFEDWKRQNLAKAGQTAENLGARIGGGGESRRTPGGINNALDSLGEDTEIEIDFGGFVDPGSSMPTPLSAKSRIEKDSSAANNDDKKSTAAAEDPSGVRTKGKDAGKTCKERSNYASFDCAATVLKTNPESKGSTAVLVENKDNYMLNICSAKNKFLIIELCDDILIDTVVLANFEFFSSMFRTFRVSVSDRYPVKLEKWKTLGTFEARNSREVQAFLVENPLIWARYLRIEFLAHFGNEYYCPVSLLRVHGTTMMEEFNHDVKRTGTEEENDSEIRENEEDEDIDLIHGAVSAASLKEVAQQTPEQVKEASAQSFSPAPTTIVPDSSSRPIADAANTAMPLIADAVQPNAFAPYNFSISKQIEVMLSTLDISHESCRPQEKPPGVPESASISSIPPQLHQSTISSWVANATTSVAIQVSAQTSDPTIVNDTKLAERSLAPSPEQGSSATKIVQADQTTMSSIKVPMSSTQPPNANPTTQESFFKSVHKRLQLLESNTTLSLQYIEDQSRTLRDAFSKVEKRQLAKTTAFLETLNTTVLTELRNFRNQYDQIWQSTVLELSSQREQSQHEVFALSTRLSLLADEIVFQKRIAILQSLLILLCLGLVIFSRSGSASPLSELSPSVQRAIKTPSVNLTRSDTQFETPLASPSSERRPSGSGSSRDFAHERSPSEDSLLDERRSSTKRSSVEYFPLTPKSRGSPGEHHDLVAEAEGGETNNDSLPQRKSYPASPSGPSEEEREIIAKRYLRPNTDVAPQLRLD